MRTRRTKQQTKAFTLIEVILAVGVMAILLAAVHAVFFSAMRLRERTCQAVDDALPLEQALATLRHDLQCAVPPGGVLAGSFRVGDITESNRNEAVSMELCTATGALREFEPWADIQRVTYELREPESPDRNGGKSLVRSVTRNLLNTVSPEVQEQALLDGVNEILFQCFDGTQWNDTWDTTTGSTNLPSALRVVIQLAGREGDLPMVETVVPIVSMPVATESQE
jgi:general secretion pathway protein J